MVDKTIAEESLKTKKIRLKLLKKIEQLDQEVTTEALERQVQEIHGWIAKNAMHRSFLLEKEIALFDENKNTAPVSRKIVGIVTQIEKEIQDNPGLKILQRMLETGSSSLLEKE